MHRFFELISVGEEIIQEAEGGPGFFARQGARVSRGAGWAKKKAGSGYGGGKAGLERLGTKMGYGVHLGGAATGRGVARLGARVGSSIEKGAGKAGQFAAKHAGRAGEFVARHPKKFAGGALLAAGAGGYSGGKQLNSKYRVSRKHESAIEEGAGWDAVKAAGKAVYGSGRGMAGKARGKAAGGKNYLKTKGIGAANWTGNKMSSGASGLGASIAKHPARWGAGAVGVAGAGAGYGGYRALRRQESALPELSADLQENFLTNLFKKKSLLKRGGEAVVGGTKKTGGFLAKHKGKIAAGAAGAGAGFVAGRGSK